jgi:hypothetical protein
MMARHWNGNLKIEERFEVGDRLGMGKGDDFHERTLSLSADDGEWFDNWLG